MMADDTIEIQKLRKENAHVYRMPPMTSSSGHTLDDYSELIFKGNMKITVKGDFCIVYFLNPDESIFLISIINQDIEKYVLQTHGSTRYFTIKAMTPDKVVGVYGLVFKQRSDAFDFYNTLTDYKEKYLFEKSLLNKEEYKPKYEFNSNMNIGQGKEQLQSAPTSVKTTNQTTTEQPKK